MRRRQTKPGGRRRTQLGCADIWPEEHGAVGLPEPWGSERDEGLDAGRGEDMFGRGHVLREGECVGLRWRTRGRTSVW